MSFLTYWFVGLGVVGFVLLCLKLYLFLKAGKNKQQPPDPIPISKPVPAQLEIKLSLKPKVEEVIENPFREEEKVCRRYKIAAAATWERGTYHSKVKYRDCFGEIQERIISGGETDYIDALEIVDNVNTVVFREDQPTV